MEHSFNRSPNRWWGKGLITQPSAGGNTMIYFKVGADQERLAAVGMEHGVTKRLTMMTTH